MTRIALDQSFRPSQIRVGTVIERMVRETIGGKTVEVKSPCCTTTWRITTDDRTYVMAKEGRIVQRRCGSCDYRYDIAFITGGTVAEVTARGDGPGRAWRKR